MLTAIVIKQDQQISELARKLKEVKKQMKKPNLFISGLIESLAEETQYQKLSIKDAFRQGQGNPRQMYVVFSNLDDKYKVLSKSFKVKGKRNVRRRLCNVTLTINSI